ncbi:hypothetical protein BHM03_00020408 [Ensete ventricosum]|nr:hypothetical protein BHM03_00020408 [Ensete ventricosum]
MHRQTRALLSADATASSHRKMVALLSKGVRFSCASSSSVAIRESVDRANSIALPITGRRGTRTKSQCAAPEPMPTDGSVSPTSSSRYLLSSTALLSDDPSFSSSRGDEEESVSTPPISSPRPHDLQCPCIARVAKGSVDSATKKVTVVGDVTPSGVLDSISKVKKNARFWSSPPQSSASSQLKEPYY